MQVVAADGGSWALETPALNGSGMTHHPVGVDAPVVPTAWGRQGAADVSELRGQVRTLQTMPLAFSCFTPLLPRCKKLTSVSTVLRLSEGRR